MWITNSPPISRDEAVQALLGSTPKMIHYKGQINKKASPIFVGWGNKPSTEKSRRWAKALSIPYHQLEDGFIAYLSHPSLNPQRLSLIHDTTGIYYDARTPSDLSALLHTLRLTDAEKFRTQLIIKTITEYGISKYNQEKSVSAETLNAIEPDSVVIIDQTAGDASITGALAEADDFFQMVEHAINHQPSQHLYLKVHPDVLLGKKQGVIYAQIHRYPNLRILPTEISTKQLFTRIKTLYTVSSQMGIEALWYNCKVHCFGVPFYSGYGLTCDHKKAPHERLPISLETLTFGALIKYCQYIHPETHELCTIEDILPFIIQGKQLRHTHGYATLYAVDFSLWKRLLLPPWLAPLSKNIVFCNKQKAIKQATKDDAILLWSNNHREIKHDHVIRMEDGFIRSNGLGVDLTPPLSLVLDTRGIYFDATRPSDLEYLLENKQVTEAQSLRAESLIRQIQENRISKYNLKKPRIALEVQRNNYTSLILVPGQVESDASIRFGVLDGTTIFSMLKQARQDNPNAFIIYRPHPDVLTGERTGLTPTQAQPYADFIDCDSDIHSTLDEVDEVHVLTSLVGFEALLKKKKVVCYGLPFYAGFGLTQDKVSTLRRSKVRTLSELCFLTLIQYPRYLHPDSELDTSAESTIDILTSQDITIKTGISHIGRLLQKIRFLNALAIRRLRKI